MKNDKELLGMALANAVRSAEDGNFPAGGIVAVDGEVIASAVSSPYPGLFHADSKAVKEAFDSGASLKRATLYVTLEPCLMCTGVTYWSGIRRIVYAIPKDQVNPEYYETARSTTDLINNFNEQIERIHLDDLQAEALMNIKAWEQKRLN